MSSVVLQSTIQHSYSNCFCILFVWGEIMQELWPMCIKIAIDNCTLATFLKCGFYFVKDSHEDAATDVSPHVSLQFIILAVLYFPLHRRQGVESRSQQQVTATLTSCVLP